MSTLSHKKWLRVAVGIGVPLGASALALFFLWAGRTPPCVFYELTGFYCAGCGAGRAFLALLHGELYAALRLQPLMLLLLPFIGYYCLKRYIAFVFGRDVLPFPTVRGRFLGIFVLVLILSYWVLRNVPVFPFTLLAPTVV
ncbi:MAG: DUF2752 domain-containing protein [Clostridia bacterium]|nr:DUF2752 domain-containing protein [Clostridia bacterium]